MKVVNSNKAYKQPQNPAETDTWLHTFIKNLKEDITGRVVTAVLSAIVTVVVGGVVWIRTTGSDLVTAVSVVEAHEERLTALEDNHHDLLIYFKALFSYMGIDRPDLD